MKNLIKKNQKKGFTLIELMIVLAIVGIILAVILPAGLGSVFAGGDLIKRRQIKGIVLNEGSRLAGRATSETNSINEKFAVNLGNVEGDKEILEKFSSANNTLMVDCESTRCSALTKEQQVEFACKIDGRFFRPNVVVCDMVK